MTESDKLIVGYVYYRDVPACLLSMLALDPAFSYTKDGVLKGAGHSCPRMTILYKKTGTQEDVKVISKLQKLLEELESNNQVVNFNLTY